MENSVEALKGFHQCSVPKCANQGSYNSAGFKLFYFPFPTEQNEIQNWLRACRIETETSEKFLCCCHEHFEENSIENKGSERKLLKESIPKKFEWNRTETKEEIKIKDEKLNFGAESKTHSVPEQVYGPLMVSALSSAVEHLKRRMSEVRNTVERSEFLLGEERRRSLSAIEDVIIPKSK